MRDESDKRNILASAKALSSRLLRAIISERAPRARNPHLFIRVMFALSIVSLDTACAVAFRETVKSCEAALNSQIPNSSFLRREWAQKGSTVARTAFSNEGR